MRHTLVLITALILSSCVESSPRDGDGDGDADAEALHPFVGCWENETGLEREGWTIDPSGWLIGYAANRTEEGDVTFFEHMRVERSGEVETLVVSGQDGSTVRFDRKLTDDPSEYRFENPDHDFPQVITYQRDGNRLNAWISNLDNSNRINFPKTACRDAS